MVNKSHKKRHQRVMKELLYHFLIKNETQPLYNIREGIKQDYYFAYSTEPGILFNTHFPYAPKQITLKYVLQPFVSISVYHDYTCDQTRVDQLFNEFSFLFNDFMTKLDSDSDDDEPKQLFLKTILITCDSNEKKTCDICVKTKRKFSACEQCEKEICVECMLTMQKNVLKTKVDACDCCNKAVKCPFCRHPFPVISKTEEMFLS